MEFSTLGMVSGNEWIVVALFSFTTLFFEFTVLSGIHKNVKKLSTLIYIISIPLTLRLLTSSPLFFIVCAVISGTTLYLMYTVILDLNHSMKKDQKMNSVTSPIFPIVPIGTIRNLKINPLLQPAQETTIVICPNLRKSAKKMEIIRYVNGTEIPCSLQDIVLHNNPAVGVKDNNIHHYVKAHFSAIPDPLILKLSGDEVEWAQIEAKVESFLDTVYRSFPGYRVSFMSLAK